VTYARSVLLIALLAVTGCTRSSTSPLQAAAPTPPAVDARMSLIDGRKDELLRQLAVCESGAHGDAAVPVIGGRGLYIGRFQFMPRTVITYVQQKDGRELNWREATELAHDYSQAAALAKWVIFERDGLYNWPLCARKLGLAKQVAEIKSL
jgi:hypothetical protein